MRHIVGLIQVVLIALMVTSCSSKNDNSESAKAIARQWVNDNIDMLSDKLGATISEDYPAVVGFAIKTAVKSGVSWEYSAYREETDRWRVIVGAKIDMNIPLVEKSLKASGDFPLLINTEASEIIQTNFDPSSFKFALDSTSPPAAPSRSESAGRPIGIANECNHPIHLWLRHKETDGNWYLTTVANFYAGEGQRRMRVEGEDILFSGNEIYYYAESTDGSNLAWTGDLERKPLDRNETVKYKRVTFDPSWDNPLLRVQCTD